MLNRKGNYRLISLMLINKKIISVILENNITALKKNSKSRNSKINSKNARMIQY